MPSWETDENQCQPCQDRKHTQCVDGGGKPDRCLCGCH